MKLVRSKKEYYNKDMKKNVKFLIFFSILFFIAAFSIFPESSADNPEAQRITFQRNGMLVLGGWAVGNFAVSGFLMSRSTGTPFYFNQMNVFWNTVNLGIALFGYFTAGNADVYSPIENTIAEYTSFRKILLINAGLDAGYMATGVLLKYLSGKSDQHEARLDGYGNSLLLQGGFLLGFDLIMAAIAGGLIKDLI